jgi:TP901 family phage tail tape measure protein
MNNPLVTLKLLLDSKLKGGLDKAKQVVSDRTKEMQDRLNSLKTTHIQAFKSMGDSIPGFGNVMAMLGNPYTLIIAGVVALTAVFGKARAEAAQWEGGMAKVNVTAQLTKTELGALSDKVLEIGARNTTPLQEVPEAFNRIISAGLDTNTALAALEPTLKAAKAGFTDVETTAMAAVSVMNSSGVMDANRVYDVLFATLNRGNAEFKDIANYLPKIIPLAKNAGFELEQVAGAFAFLTAQGLKSEAAGTGLMNVFKAMSDDSVINGGRGKLGLKGLGIDVFDAKGQAKTLVEIIEQIKSKTDSLTGAEKVKFFDQIGLDTEASSSIAIMTQNIDKLKENIDFTTNSAGQLNKAVENSAQAGDSWKIIGNQVTKTFIEIGKPINESFGNLGKKLLPYAIQGLGVMKSVLSGVWRVVSDVGEVAWKMVEPIVDFISKSELLADVWEGIKGTAGVLIDWIKGVGDALAFLHKWTLKPILDGIEYTYKLMKQMTPVGLQDRAIKAIYQQKMDKGEMTPGQVHEQLGPELSTRLFPEIAAGKKAYMDNYTSFINGLKPNKDANLYDDKTKSFKLPGEKDKKENSGMAISGKAEQVRNITIHAGTIGIDGDVVSNSKDMQGLTKKDVAEICSDIFNRFVQSLEKSYG